MAYDPAYPADHAEIRAVDFRAQFNGLKDLIDNIPAGPPGPPGNDGAQGPAGNDGNPGEVTNAALNDAIAGTARNPTGLSTLDTPYADPASEELRVAYNTLLTAVLRLPT